MWINDYYIWQTNLNAKGLTLFLITWNNLFDTYHFVFFYWYHKQTEYVNNTLKI